MDVETVFRATFGIKKEQDIVGLIEAAVNVAALIVPDKLKKHRSRIVKLLFDEDPLNSTDDLFSDDELGFDEDDGDKLIDRPKVAVSSPPPPKKEEIKKGFKKAVELMSEKIVGRQDNSMELKILGHKAIVNSKERFWMICNFGYDLQFHMRAELVLGLS
nr:hypothetical protein DM860_006244 [Ipomoea batatas]